MLQETHQLASLFNASQLQLNMNCFGIIKILVIKKCISYSDQYKFRLIILN